MELGCFDRYNFIYIVEKDLSPVMLHRKDAMNISLSPELERLISEKIQSGQYRSVDEVIREGLELLQAKEATTHVDVAKNSTSLTDVFGAIASDVPESEWAHLPTDLSKNLDRYLYGS